MYRTLAVLFRRHLAAQAPDDAGDVPQGNPVRVIGDVCGPIVVADGRLHDAVGAAQGLLDLTLAVDAGHAADLQRFMQSPGFHSRPQQIAWFCAADVSFQYASVA